MAQPDFTSPPTLRVAAPKPKMTVYYGLLIIALICMLMACLFLYLEIRRFGGFGTVPQRISAIERPEVFVHHGGHRGRGEELTRRQGEGETWRFNGSLLLASASPCIASSVTSVTSVVNS